MFRIEVNLNGQVE